MSLVDNIDGIISTTISAILNNFTTISTNDLVEETIEQPEPWETWTYGFLVVTVSAFGPPTGLLLLPYLSKNLYEKCMTFLVALGIGAMSGSAFFILLPHAFNVTQLNEMEYLEKSWLIVSALYLFFAVDRFLQWILEVRRKRRHCTSKVHASTLEDAIEKEAWRKSSILTRREPTVQTVDRIHKVEDGRSREVQSIHSAPEYDREKCDLEDEIDVSSISNAFTRSFSTRKQIAVIRPEPVNQIVYQTADGERYSLDVKSLNSRCSSRCQSPQRSPQLTPKMSTHAQTKLNGHTVSPHNTVHFQSPINKPSVYDDPELTVSVEMHEKRVIDKSRIEVASVAYMIIFGSSLNNFVDGMSMGAAFSDSIVRGFGLGIAAISQQFPAELGTLAILVKSGLGIKRTLILTVVMGIVSYFGFAMGIVLDQLDDSYDVYIFSFSAGMYLYIVLGTLLPEIREQFNNQLREESGCSTITTTILQTTGIFIGLNLMFYMNLSNDEI
ncbi:hypothetical protein M3Y96_00665900 [Aphelenchoides besseyi]|nr:hypothetical protein M3Y96_00665900 [Aphelenchoides besseyi]